MEAEQGIVLAQNVANGIGSGEGQYLGTLAVDLHGTQRTRPN